MWFDVWVLGFARDGVRKAEYAVSVETIEVAPVGTEDATKWRIIQSFSRSINAGKSDPNPQVTAPTTTTTRDETLTGWHTTPHWTLTYTPPDTGKAETGNHQRVNATVTMTLGANSPNADSSYSEVGAFHFGVRFDYTGAVAGKYKGTVFTEARVELVLSLSDDAIKESTRHFLDAQQYPERTFPSWPGKNGPRQGRAPAPADQQGRTGRQPGPGHRHLPRCVGQLRGNSAAVRRVPLLLHPRGRQRRQ
ncbi:hypothetical protein ACLIYP_19440 [Streptomyces nanhaiensis]|uniref:hypothetical protein n=1 Tax=Streptomyces nanhaiensis TaxID=679319 RepID=UPI00399CC57B